MGVSATKPTQGPTRASSPDASRAIGTTAAAVVASSPVELWAPGAQPSVMHTVGRRRVMQRMRSP